MSSDLQLTLLLKRQAEDVSTIHRYMKGTTMPVL
jgi:hypothetical protein